MRSYDYRHVVSFEETNVVGNVYYVHYLRWQGRCREFFLREHAPSVFEELTHGLILVTTHCSCDYFEELAAFDEVTIRVILRDVAQSRINLDFEYRRGDSLVAKGSQQIACMRKENGVMRPTALPDELREALRP